MTHLLDLMREDVRHTLNRLTDLRSSLKKAQANVVGVNHKEIVRPYLDCLMIDIFREQQELLAFRRDIVVERKYRDERESRDSFPRHPYASEFYPAGKL